MARMALALVAVLALAIPGCIQVDLPDRAPVDREAAGQDADADGARRTTPTRSNSATASSSRPAPGPGPTADPGTTTLPENASEPPPPPGSRRTVVVAQFDTGTNPFHPCMRRPGQGLASPPVDGLPAATQELRLAFQDDYRRSLDGSATALAGIRGGALYRIPETPLLFYGTSTELVDDYPHGAQASSQVVCAEYGLAPDALLVVLNWYDEPSSHADYLDWVAAQPWIDVVHLNIQDLPAPAASTTTQAIAAVIASGKLVVIAAGNGVAGTAPSYPMEASSYNGPPGSLIAGANDNSGHSWYSNLDPHVVMDGCGTAAASPDSFGETDFSGTSSASPRLAGYAARLLRDVRDALDADRGPAGVLARMPADAERPTQGPMADGDLTPAELHEAIRKTATPVRHASHLDGEDCLTVPDASTSTASVYAKNGYGEVSDVTLPAALAVLLGEAPMPERPVEDRFYAASEAVREAYWG